MTISHHFTSGRDTDEGKAMLAKGLKIQMQELASLIMCLKALEGR